MGKALTRDEHERICSERNERVEKQIDGLREDMQRRHEENRANYSKIEETIEAGITGTHQRLDALYRDLMNQRSGRG